MSSSIILPITSILERMNKGRDTQLTFDEFKAELLAIDENGDRKYSLNMKEHGTLAIIYYDDVQTNSRRDVELPEWEKNTRSVVWDKVLMQPIASQYGKIIYNEEAVDLLAKVDWNRVVVEPCYEGTTILVFNHDDTWYVTTRRCLDANESSWIKRKSYREMFNETMEGKFTFDDLNPDYCYHFVLLHYLNRNIVTYSEFGNMYKEIIHTLTTRKYTCQEVHCKVSEQSRCIQRINFGNLNQLLDEVEELSKADDERKQVTTEGFIVRVYEGDVENSPFQVMKIQSELYQMLLKMKPNNSNIHQSYLELYQRDKLREFILYFRNGKGDIIKRINMAMRQFATEILNMYHGTRKKKNPEVYADLMDNYRKVLYELHGVYIENKKYSPEDGEGKSSSITVHDVYFYLKNLSPEKLRQLFLERWSMLQRNDCKSNIFMDKGNIHINIQTLLMFKNLIELPVKTESA